MYEICVLEVSCAMRFDGVDYDPTIKLMAYLCDSADDLILDRYNNASTMAKDTNQILFYTKTQSISYYTT